jgi:hypothetical protein
MPMRGREYNGHKNYEYWNVSLWLGNEEPLYRLAVDCKKKYGITVGARVLKDLVPERTPDGALYTTENIKAFMRGLDS